MLKIQEYSCRIDKMTNETAHADADSKRHECNRFCEINQISLRVAEPDICLAT